MPTSGTNISSEEQRQSDAVDEAVRKVTELNLQEAPLYTLSSVWPFDFFPTKLVIDRTKVSVISTIFFGAQHIESIVISEIMLVEVNTSIFFASLKIISRLPNAEPFVIPMLIPDQAQRARRIIQGLMVSMVAKVDLMKLPALDLLQTVERLGSTKVAAA